MVSNISQSQSKQHRSFFVGGISVDNRELITYLSLFEIEQILTNYFYARCCFQSNVQKIIERYGNYIMRRFRCLYLFVHLIPQPLYSEPRSLLKQRRQNVKVFRHLGAKLF